MVRKSRQHFLEFRAYLKQQAERLGKDEEWLAAKMVGRWRDGTPLATHPDRPPGIDPASRPTDANLFLYADDPEGRKVPLGSHIRRVNPRDGLANGIGFVRGHRIVRRGLPYGPPLPPDAAGDDGKDRGVFFMVMNTDIENQFEFIQAAWMNSGSFAGLDSSHKDPVLGDNDGTGTMSIPLPDGQKRRLFGLPRFVTVRFGAYLFMPGLRALRLIAAGL